MTEIDPRSEEGRLLRIIVQANDALARMREAPEDAYLQDGDDMREELATMLEDQADELDALPIESAIRHLRELAARVRDGREAQSWA